MAVRVEAFTKPLGKPSHMQRLGAGMRICHGGHDSPESGGEGSRDHRVEVPQVWTPDQEHQHALGTVRDGGKSPGQIQH